MKAVSILYSCTLYTVHTGSVVFFPVLGIRSHFCPIWIYIQWRFKDFFQGVAEISSGGGENLPGGGEKNVAAPLSPQRFFAFLHTILLIYAHFFIF